MDLKSYLAILKGNIWVILITTMVTVVVAAAISFMMTPIYSATTTLRIASASTGTVAYSDYVYAERLLNTYIKLATSRPVLDELRTELGIQQLPEIKVEVIPNTELIKVTVDSSDPQLAQISANALADILVVKGKELYSGGEQSTQEILLEQIKLAEEELTQAREEYDAYLSSNPEDSVRLAAMSDAIKLKENTYASLLELYDDARLKEIIRANTITVVEPAVAPSTPSKPNKFMNIALGLVVGLAGGVGLAFFFESLGTGLYTSRQIEAVTEMNTIGKIPIMHKNQTPRFWSDNHENLNSAFKDAIRRLYIQIATQKAQNSNGHPIKTILLTSSHPREGKSLITFNLAKTIAQTGKKVVVVDCDLHVPAQHILCEVSNDTGLSTVLNGEATLEESVQRTQYSNLYVLTSGALPPDPTKILGSPEMKSLIKALSKDYDLILLDAPALLAIADTALLVPIVDGVMFIARRNYIKEGPVREACRQLVDLNANIIGLVVNEAEKYVSTYYDQRR